MVGRRGFGAQRADGSSGHELGPGDAALRSDLDKDEDAMRLDPRMSRREAIAGALTAGVTLSGAAARAQDKCRVDRLGPFSGAMALERAQCAMGRRTVYDFGASVRPKEAWPKTADCSGLILYCFGLVRKDFPSKTNEGSTDAIYKDIVSTTGHFVRTPKPQVGGIVIYPSFTLAGWKDDDSGHVGLIKSVAVKTICKKGTLWPGPDASDYEGIEEQYPLEIYDCSSTSWWTFGDAVRVSDYTKFLLHDQLIVATRKAQMAAGGRTATDPRATPTPIYAVIRSDERRHTTPARVGHCA